MCVAQGVDLQGQRTRDTLQLCDQPSAGARLHRTYAIAVVELAEGPRMMTNIVECPQTPEALQLDMHLEVVFEKQNDEITLPFFKPAGA